MIIILASTLAGAAFAVFVFLLCLHLHMTRIVGLASPLAFLALFHTTRAISHHLNLKWGLLIGTFSGTLLGIFTNVMYGCGGGLLLFFLFGLLKKPGDGNVIPLRQ